MSCLPMISQRSHLNTPGSEAKSGNKFSSPLDVGKSPISPLLDMSCDWIMREAALELLQLPHLGHTPDNHLFKAARAAAANVAGTKRLLSNRSVERPSKSSPAVSASRRGRKRTRKGRASCEPPQANIIGNQYVMTLFDRSVDLAQHSEGTSLYVMCRSWIGDIRHSGMSSPYLEIAGISPNVASKDGDTDIWMLPPPSPTAGEQQHVEDSDVDSSSTGVETVCPDASSVDSSVAGGGAEEQLHSASNLLTEHMASWKRCRRTKMRRAQVEYMRHAKSVDILRRIRNSVLNMSSSTLTSLA
ncbi:protein lin-37 homolog [Sycon ciliatum]|uniref:protein lin-37 homolog n=1 Tax=Sycon ciliatum TaxID=27933 RepID=UPI0020AA5932|eukprot:scpid51668/ scgid25704/ 